MSGGPSMLDAALGLASRGLAVFPVHSFRNGRCSCRHGAECDEPGKHPRIAAWGDEATTDERAIRAWWTRWPTANIGVPTSPQSGVWVLDVDLDGDEDGRLAYRRLEAELGPFPATVHADTGGGGLHVWWRRTDARRIVGTIGQWPGIDVRGDGNYVVAPPSLHRSGARYEWPVDGDPFEDATFAPAPPALLDLVVEKPRPPRAPDGERRFTIPRPRPSQVVLHTRDVTLFRYACSLRAAGWTAEEIEREILETNRLCCDPPLSERQAVKCARRAALYERGIPLRSEPSPNGRGQGEGDPAKPPTTQPPNDLPEDEGWDGIDATDVGNALRLERRFGEHLRWCDNWLRWLVWDGAGWAQDSESGPRSRHLAHTLTAEMMRRTDLGKGFVNYAKKCRASGKISAMLKECSAVPGLLIRSDDLDTHDDLLAVANGTVDLRTGALRASEPSLLISRRSPLAYDPEARCPVFEAYLEQIMKGRLGLVDLLVRALGYSMTGQTRDHKFFLLYGDRGRNGKGTLLGTMQMVLGRDLCSPISKRLLTNAQSSDARFDMAMLEGLRLVFANEAKDGTRLDSEWIKEYSSGDPMRVERKGVDSYEITPKGKLWYGVNSLPSTEFDTAYGSRVIPIPFEQSYYPRAAAEWREGDLEPDLDLRAKLRAELPGILAFLVRAAGMYYERGFAELPDEVNRVKREYREANDPVSDFIAERCEPGGGERRGVLYEAFREWAKAQGRPWKGGPQAFAARIEREPGVRTTHDGGIYMVRGIHKRYGEMPPPPTDDLYAEGE